MAQKKSINDFQALMNKGQGFARPARYEVVLHPPPGLAKLFPNTLTQGFSLMCDSITMPGHDLQASAIKFGTEVETQMVVSHGYTGLISATFYLDHNLDLKEYFDAWQFQAVNTDTNVVSYYETDDGIKNYVGSIDIHQLGSMPTTDTTYSYPQSEIEGAQYKDAPVDRFGHELPVTKTQVKYNERYRTYSIEVEEVYPETIGAIEYAYATVDEVARLTVGFQYRKWDEIPFEKANPSFNT